MDSQYHGEMSEPEPNALSRRLLRTGCIITLPCIAIFVIQATEWLGGGFDFLAMVAQMFFFPIALLGIVYMAIGIAMTLWNSRR